MIIGGFQPCSFCDYPGRTSAVIFSQGCGFRCPFCHNRSLWPREPAEGECLDPAVLFAGLRERRNLLGGITVSGGEPTFHDDLPQFLAQLRTLGLPVKLDTNGARPALLAEIIRAGLADYIALDIKAPWEKYARLSGVPHTESDVRRSMALIASSGIAHEFRTTMVPGMLDESDLAEIRRMLPPGSVHRQQTYRSPRP